MKLALAYSVLLTMSLSAYSQNWTRILDSNDNLEDIMTKVDSFYSSNDSRTGLDYKHYRRWKYQAELRQTPNSDIVNVSAQNFTAYARQTAKQTFDRSTYGGWQELGPFDYNVSDVFSSGGVGRVNCTAFHPDNASIIYVGTAGGGVWKTIDGGTTWSPITDGFASISITDIIIDPADPDRMFILTGDGDASPPLAGVIGASFPGTKSIGVIKSEDGGATWAPTGLSFGVTENVYGYKMLMHPSSADTLYVATKGRGIYRTNDGATTWTQTHVDTVVWDIEFTPGSTDTMIATTHLGVIRSFDAGQTWFNDDDASFPTTYERAEIAMAPSDPARVYIVFGGDTNLPSQYRGLFLSEDYGATFVPRSTSPNILGSSETGGSQQDQAWYDLTIIVDPSDATRVFVGGVNCWKSENSGGIWTRMTIQFRGGPSFGPYVHADWHEMYFQESRLWANVDGGIYYSDDLGGSWTEVTSGLSIMQFYEIDILGNTYMGGSQDNGTNEDAIDDTQCHQILGADGFGCQWHTGDNTIQYLSTQNAIYRRQFGTPVPISPIELGNGDYWYTEIEMHTTDPDYVFVTSNPGGAAERELFRGNGNGVEFTWDDLGLSDLGNYTIRNFQQGVSHPDTMFVATTELLFKTTNLSATSPTWTASNLTFYTEDVAPTDVAMNPANADQVWASVQGYTAGNKVWYSSNGGSSWTNISGSLPNVLVNCLEYSTNGNGGIYAGTDIGVFYRDSAMGDWIFFSNYLPNVMVTDMEIREGYLYAATFGRGIWRSPLYSSCLNTLVLTQANDTGNSLSPGTQIFSANTALTSTRIYQGGLGTNITYNSGNRIDLKPGFHTKAGSELLAQIEGCPD